MRTIWKFKLNTGLATSVDVSEKAKIALIATDPESREPAIWIETDKDGARTVTRKFKLVGTGREVPENAHHVGSCTHGPYVWHVYELHIAPQLKMI